VRESLKRRIDALERRVGGTRAAMAVSRIHGGAPAPLHATSGPHRWDCGADEPEAIFELRVVAEAAQLGEFNITIAGTRGAAGRVLKPWAPDVNDTPFQGAE
jgi:hypothetical protein